MRSKRNKMPKPLAKPAEDETKKPLLGTLSSENIDLILASMDQDLRATVVLSAISGNKEHFLEVFSSACDAMYFRKMSAAIKEAEHLMDHGKNQDKRFEGATKTQELILKGRAEGYMV